MLFEMTKLVHNDVINYPNRGHDDFPVKIHSTVSGAAAPARLKGPDAYPHGVHTKDGSVSIHFNAKFVVSSVFVPADDRIANNVWLFRARGSRDN